MSRLLLLFSFAFMMSGLTGTYPLFEKGKRPLQKVSPPKKTNPKYHPLSAMQCKKCHTTVYNQWKKSRHAQAYTNRLFQVALIHGPYRWCIHCHAPLPEQFNELLPVMRFYHPKKKVPAYVHPTTLPAKSTTRPSKATSRPAKVASRPSKVARKYPPLHKEGVNCAACHIRNGVILTSKAPTEFAKNIHPIKQDKRFGTSQYCAGCHQFNFVKKLTDPIHRIKVPTQNTLQEWLQSHASKQGKTCQSCHMPKGSHFFPGSHNISFLKKSISAKVHFIHNQKLQVVLRTHGVGHSVPTGDPFRRLRLMLCQDKACKKLIRHFYLRRIFRTKNNQLAPFVDFRIPPPKKSLSGKLAFKPTLPKPYQKVYWRLYYYYAEHHHHRFLSDKEKRTLVVQGNCSLKKKSKKKK